jgi:hypothetical protein
MPVDFDFVSHPRQPEPTLHELLRIGQQILATELRILEAQRKTSGEVEELERRVVAFTQQQSQVLALVQAILKALTPPVAATIAFEFSPSSQQGENMPLSMPANIKNERYFIIGADADGLTGAQLAAGQTITVVADDPNTVALTADSAPGVDNEGVQSVASGSVGVGPTPNLNTPINVTATVLNSDGSTAEQVVDTVTITPVVPGVAVSIGELFEAPVAGVPATARRR